MWRERTTFYGAAIAFVARGIDSVTASRKALGAVYGMVQQHATMLAFVEAFWIMGVVFLLMLAFLPLLQYSKPVRAAKGVAEPEKAVLPSHIPEVLPDSLDHETYDEEHDLVLH